MIEFSYLWIDIECPNCAYQDEIQLVDVKSEKVIFCNNCKCSIQLKDSEASVHSGVEDINNALQKLDDIFKSFSK